MKVKTMKAAKDWMGLLLMGLGINLAPHEFWGGMFMALGMAMLARHFTPEVDQREIAIVLMSAALIAIIAVEVVHYFVPEFPGQLIMAAAGFFSRYVIRIALRMAGRLERKADIVTDKVIEHVLPGSKSPPESTEQGGAE